MRFLLVASGGALGSIARYALTEFVHRYAPASFPYGTFVVNAMGCMLFGVVISLAEGRVLLGTGARTFLLVGVLGGFTGRGAHLPGARMTSRRPLHVRTGVPS